MDVDQVNASALAIFKAISLSNGMSKSAAEDAWRRLGSDGRKRWRDAARAAAIAKPKIRADWWAA